MPTPAAIQAFVFESKIKLFLSSIISRPTLIGFRLDDKYPVKDGTPKRRLS